MLALVIVLLGKAESGIFDSVRAKLSDWTSPILEGVREPLAGLQRWLDNTGSIFTVYEENIRLKQQVAELRKWQEVARSLQRRLDRYEVLLKAVPDAELSSVQARVIGQSSRPFIKTMILNAGEDQGVKAGQAVLDDRGLIGRIYVTGNRTSWVILLGDLNSRVPVTIQPSNRRAMLTGDNSAAPSLEFDAINVAGVNAGDRVYSSGDGGQLPPGLPVGVVVDEDGTLRVALFADPDATDYVHVVDYEVPPQPRPDAAAREMPVTPLAAQTPAQPPPQTNAPTVATPPPQTAVHTPSPKPAQVRTPPRRRVRPAPATQAPATTTAAATPTPAPAAATPAPEPAAATPAPEPAAPSAPAPTPAAPERATPDNSPGPEPDQ